MEKQLKHDMHTMSILIGHIVFSSKYSVSFIAKRLKGRRNRILQQKFPEIKLRNQKIETLYTSLGLKSWVIGR
jgi:REP element-mobilizing transposase RayT